jgi:hypothetical protein
MANTTLIFGADDAEGDRNLWGYNHVTGNVAPVALSNPGSSGGPPRYDLYDLNGKIVASYITEDDVPQIGYFNGTEVEFIGSATDNNFDPELDNFIEYAGDLYFTLEPNGSERAIIKYDPDTNTLTNITEGSLFKAGTQRLVVFNDGSGEKLYFDAQPNEGDLRTLYRWDGSTIEAAPNFSGTDEVAEMAVFNGAIYVSSTPPGAYYFNNSSTSTYDDNKLYKYDGASVIQIKDFSSEVYADPYIQDFTIFNNKLFFTVSYFPSGIGGRVYSIDTAGNITTEYTAFSDASTNGTPGNLTVHNGELYFTVRLYNSGSQTDIYKYNSTGNATNISSGATGYSKSDLANLTSYEDGLLYQQDTGQGKELQYLNLLDNTVTQLTDINDAGDSMQNNSADSPYIVYQGNIAPLVNGMDLTSVISKNSSTFTVNPEIEVFEIDDNAIKSAQVSFSSGFKAGDTLAVTDMHGISST